MQTRSSLVALVVAAAACAPPPPEPVVVIGAASAPSPDDPAKPDAPPPPRRRAPPPAAPPAPLDAVRDPRWRSPRAVPLLIAEIQGLESWFATMPQADPNRPNLVRRLADGYAELEAASLPDATRAKTVPAARKAATRHYELLARQYTKWCASPHPSDPAKSTGCADEALYYLGLEHERSGDLINARRAYFQLVQAWPQSRFIPSAYLAFGEMFLLEAATFSAALPLAEKSYLEVLKYPPPDNAVYGYAQFQLAQVRSKSGDPKGAAEAFKKAISWSRTYPSAVGAAGLADAAQNALDALGVP
jgi:TolA-binding protein